MVKSAIWSYWGDPNLHQLYWTTNPLIFVMLSTMAGQNRWPYFRYTAYLIIFVYLDPLVEQHFDDLLRLWRLPHDGEQQRSVAVPILGSKQILHLKVCKNV